MKTINLLLVFCLLAFQSIYSQNEHNDEHDTDEHHEQHSEHGHHKHSVAFAMSHTHIASGIKNNKGNKWLAVPSFMLNYNYQFNEKWAIGLHNDIIIEEFEVEDNRSNHNNNSETFNKNEDEEEAIGSIERSRPISMAIMIGYKIHEHIALGVGGGMEFSKHENFAVVRFGVETPFHIPNNWEIFSSFTYDVNIDAYNSFSFGIGIAKLF